MSQHIVVVVDKLPQLVSQVLKRDKVPEPRYLASNNSQPDLYLVHPRCMLRNEVKMDAMQRVAKKSLSRMPVLQDSATSFFSKTVCIDTALLSDKANTRFAAMSIEVVQDYPKASLRIELNHSLQVV